MAMEKAVVTTPKAVEGIQVQHNEHLLVEDSSQGFSRAVCRLLNDDRLRNELGARARKLVTANYDWPTNMKKLEDLLQA